MARLAAEKLAAGTSEEGFYTAKLQTARFYFQRILPRTRTHVVTMLSGANNLMDMKEEDFALGYSARRGRFNQPLLFREQRLFCACAKRRLLR